MPSKKQITTEELLRLVKKKVKIDKDGNLYFSCSKTGGKVKLSKRALKGLSTKFHLTKTHKRKTRKYLVKEPETEKEKEKEQSQRTYQLPDQRTYHTGLTRAPILFNERDNYGTKREMERKYDELKKKLDKIESDKIKEILLIKDKENLEKLKIKNEEDKMKEIEEQIKKLKAKTGAIDGDDAHIKALDTDIQEFKANVINDLQQLETGLAQVSATQSGDTSQIFAGQFNDNVKDYIDELIKKPDGELGSILTGILRLMGEIQTKLPDIPQVFNLIQKVQEQVETAQDNLQKLLDVTLQSKEDIDNHEERIKTLEDELITSNEKIAKHQKRVEEMIRLQDRKLALFDKREIDIEEAKKRLGKEEDKLIKKDETLTEISKQVEKKRGDLHETVLHEAKKEIKKEEKKEKKKVKKEIKEEKKEFNENDVIQRIGYPPESFTHLPQYYNKVIRMIKNEYDKKFTHAAKTTIYAFIGQIASLMKVNEFRIGITHDKTLSKQRQEIVEMLREKTA